MTLKNTSVLILGAGIAGLALARALALRGAEVTVLEQAPEITEVGAGLQISPNGFAVLRGLGLDGPLRATRAPVARRVVLRDRTDRVVTALDLHGLDRPDDYLLVHRADLIDVLAKGARAAGAQIRLLQRITRVEPGARPRVVTAQDAVLSADLVIGADGLHSVLRATLMTPATPQFTGHVAWRATLPGDGGSSEVEVFMGPGRHMVTYPLRGGSIRNLVAVEERRDWVPESWSQRDDPANLRAAFAMMGPRARDLTGRVERVNLWGLFRHPIARRWSGENVALVGDAAHPTLPFMGQGANMGLEDAWVLAACLADTPDRAAAFAAYEAARRDRVTRAIRAANGNAWKYHVKAPLAPIGHLGLSVLGRVAPRLLTGNFGWLYNTDVTGGTCLQMSRSTQTGT